MPDTVLKNPFPEGRFPSFFQILKKQLQALLQLFHLYSDLVDGCDQFLHMLFIHPAAHGIELVQRNVPHLILLAASS